MQILPTRHAAPLLAHRGAIAAVPAEPTAPVPGGDQGSPVDDPHAPAPLPDDLIGQLGWSRDRMHDAQASMVAHRWDAAGAHLSRASSVLLDAIEEPSARARGSAFLRDDARSLRAAATTVWTGVDLLDSGFRDAAMWTLSRAALDVSSATRRLDAQIQGLMFALGQDAAAAPTTQATAAT